MTDDRARIRTEIEETLRRLGAAGKPWPWWILALNDLGEAFDHAIARWRRGDAEALAWLIEQAIVPAPEHLEVIADALRGRVRQDRRSRSAAKVDPAELYDAALRINRARAEASFRKARAESIADRIGTVDPIDVIRDAEAQVRMLIEAEAERLGVAPAYLEKLIRTVER